MKIAVTATSFCKRDDLKAFARHTFPHDDLIFADPDAPLFGRALIDFTQGSDALIVGRETIDAAYLEAVPSVRHISVYGVGADNIDSQACHSRNVAVLVAAGVNAASAAEHTVGLMLAVCRNIALSSSRMRQGLWVKDGGVQLTGRTVAIVGCGHIGSRVARLLQGFSCQLLLVDILDKSSLAAEVSGRLCDYRTALREADIITFHVPLTESTETMLATEQITLMPSEAIVINASRGRVICQEDLKAALQSGRLRGAGLDVFSDEPLTDADLYELDNLVATPHIAGNAWEAVQAMGEAAVRELAAQTKR